MPVPNINPTPFQNIGSTLAGGAVFPAVLAEAQGESLGANTQRAIAEANAQFAKNKAMANLPQTMGNLFADPNTAAGFAGAGQAGLNLEQLQAARSGNQAQGEHGTIAAVDTPENHAARVAAAQSLQPNTLSLGDALNTADVNVKNAQAAALQSTAGLHNVQAQAGGFRPPSPSVTPVLDAGHMQRLAYLEATLNIDPSHISRYNANPGAIDAAFSAQTGIPVEQIQAADAARVAGKPPPTAPGAAPAPPGAAPAPPGAAPAPPGAAPAPPGAAPAPPGAGLPGGVQMPPLGGNPGGTGHATLAASEKDFTSSAPNSGGGNLRRGNNLVGHSLALRDMALALQNGDFQLWNKAKNYLGASVGDPSPQNLQLAANFVGGEGDTFLAGQRGTEEGRKTLAAAFANVGNSPQQAVGAVNTLHTLLGTQFDSFRREYNSATPPGVPRRPFEQRFLSPASQQILSQYDAAHQGAAAPPPGAAAPPPGAAAPPPGAAAPLPPFNPQQPVPGVDFADEATAAQAAAHGIIKPGSKIRVGGRSATWQ